MIKIISFVDSFKHFEEPILEFLKRLWKKWVELRKIKSSKKGSREAVIIDESIQLKKILESEKWYKILLYIEWIQISTEDFSKFIEDKKMNHSDIVFIIWWAYWVDYNLLKSNIDYKISLSSMTFPHAQAIMILLEQIYRIECIKKGIKYHH